MLEGPMGDTTSLLFTLARSLSLTWCAADAVVAQQLYPSFFSLCGDVQVWSR